MTWPGRQNKFKQLSMLLQDRVSKNKRAQHPLRTLQTRQQFIGVPQLFSRAGLKGTLGNVTKASGTAWLLGMWVSHYSPATPVWGVFWLLWFPVGVWQTPMTPGVANLWLLMGVCLYAPVFWLGTLFLLWLGYSCVVLLGSSSVRVASVNPSPGERNIILVFCLLLFM